MSVEDERKAFDRLTVDDWKELCESGDLMESMKAVVLKCGPMGFNS